MSERAVPSGTALKAWAIATLVTAAAAPASMTLLDYRLARDFVGQPHLSVLGVLFSTPHLIAMLSLAILALSLARLIRHGLSDFAKAILLACLTALLAFLCNDFLLKPFFGRPPVYAFLNGGDPRFLWLAGSYQSSFPSGHAALGVAALAVLVRLHPKLFWLALLAWLAACGLLVKDNWHFLSDVIAGSYVGFTAGLLASQLWLDHLGTRSGAANAGRR